MVIPFPHCSAAWEGWVGSVSARHFYISPIKSNVIVGADLSLEFLQSVPKIIFCRNGEDQGQGREGWRWAVLHPWQQAAPWFTARCWGSTHNRASLPSLPATWSSCRRNAFQCRCRSFLTIRQLADS